MTMYYAHQDARLTARQRQVVRLLKEGLKPGQVAQRLGRSQSSVYEMLARIQARLEVDTWEEIAPPIQPDRA